MASSELVSIFHRFRCVASFSPNRKSKYLASMTPRIMMIPIPLHTHHFYLYLLPGTAAMYCDERVCRLCLYVCLSLWLSTRISQKLYVQTSQKFLHCGRVSVFVFQQCNTLCNSRFVDDVMFAHNRPGKGDTNRAYTQSDSPGGRTGSEVWCLQVPSLEEWDLTRLQIFQLTSKETQGYVACVRKLQPECYHVEVIP